MSIWLSQGLTLWRTLVLNGTSVLSTKWSVGSQAPHVYQVLVVIIPTIPSTNIRSEMGILSFKHPA